MDMKMNELARVGFVVSRQPEKHRVRVEFRDTVTAKLVSGWLPVLVPRASAEEMMRPMVPRSSASISARRGARA